jgi:hypothetical protein
MRFEHTKLTNELTAYGVRLSMSKRKAILNSGFPAWG